MVLRLELVELARPALMCAEGTTVVAAVRRAAPRGHRAGEELTCAVGDPRAPRAAPALWSTIEASRSLAGSAQLGTLWTMLSNLALPFSLFVTPVPAMQPAPIAPGVDFLGGLQARVALENLDVSLDLSDGVSLEVEYDLPEVGRVTMDVSGEVDGPGYGAVMLGDAILAEVWFRDGRVAEEATDLAGLRPAQAHAVAASVVQVWEAANFTEALDDSRDLKCTVAGGIAGATAGTLVGGSCFLFFKKKMCGTAGTTVAKYVSGWIADKCNGAQNT